MIDLQDFIQLDSQNFEVITNIQNSVTTHSELSSVVDITVSKNLNLDRKINENTMLSAMNVVPAVHMPFTFNSLLFLQIQSSGRASSIFPSKNE